MELKNYCAAPFRQVYIDNNGVAPCCKFPRQNTDLENWYAGTQLKSIQSKFLNDQLPAPCESCVREERSFGHSLRTQSNKDFDNKIFFDTKMNFVDYRANNICNFKCRSCTPAFSNGIANEARRAPNLQKFFSVKPDKVARVSSSNFDYVIQNLDQIDRLMFTGGEPTIMPEVRGMLDRVVEKHGDRIGILITTNGSFTDSFWYDLVDKIPNLHWTLSLDAVGSAAGIIRHGTHWPTVEHNAKWLAKHAASLMINTVVTNLSLFHLHPLCEFVAELQKNSNGTNGCDHQFHVSTRPYYLSADNLDSDKLQAALGYLDYCLAHATVGSQKRMLTSLIEQIKAAKFDSVLWDRCQEYNLSLDQLRGENHSVLFEPSY